MPNSSRFVKLNGCYSLLSEKGKNHLVALKDLQGESKANAEIDVLLKNLSGQIREEIEFESQINFAWESDNPASQEALEEARKIFSKTDILVIIGYSFPTFNRSVDKDLFKLLPKHCMIYYQAPENVVGELIEKFKAICKVGNVHPVKNTDQFHIPFEL